MTWGVEAHIRERFEAAGVPAEKVSMEKDTFRFESAEKSPAEFIEIFRQFYGPTMNAFDAAEKTGRVDELHAQLVDLAGAQNQGEGNGFLIPATFVRVTVAMQG